MNIEMKGIELEAKKEFWAEHKEADRIIRQFSTGATRDSDDGKPDYEGFLSPLVIERYGKYMNHHRIQSDGKLRDSDNWQKGIPIAHYMKSMWRHFVEVWSYHRKQRLPAQHNQEEALCALIFNASGYLHELLKQQRIIVEYPPYFQSTEPVEL
jgi:hypothetical protein